MIMKRGWDRVLLDAAKLTGNLFSKAKSKASAVSSAEDEALGTSDEISRELTALWMIRILNGSMF